MKTTSKKEKTIKEAVNKGFILVKDENHDNYRAAKEFLELSTFQRLQLNAMAAMSGLY